MLCAWTVRKSHTHCASCGWTRRFSAPFSTPSANPERKRRTQHRIAALMVDDHRTPQHTFGSSSNGGSKGCVCTRIIINILGFSLSTHILSFSSRVTIFHPIEKELGSRIKCYRCSLHLDWRKCSGYNIMSIATNNMQRWTSEKCFSVEARWSTQEENSTANQSFEWWKIVTQLSQTNDMCNKSNNGCEWLSRIRVW